MKNRSYLFLFLIIVYLTLKNLNINLNINSINILSRIMEFENDIFPLRI